jgi:hypothetical protein
VSSAVLPLLLLQGDNGIVAVVLAAVTLDTDDKSLRQSRSSASDHMFE